MKKHLLLFLLVLFFSNHSQGQTNFLTGTSSVSIEPDNSIFSVSLAGYGAPRDGRFSITWKENGQTPDLTAITALNGKFYAISNSGELMKGTPEQQGVKWEKAGKAIQISTMCAFRGKLYALSGTDLLTGTFSSNQVIWKKISKTEGITALTALNDKLYASTVGNELISGTYSGTALKWKKIGIATEIKSMTAHEDKIYSVNKSDSIFSAKVSQSKPRWTGIGRNNSHTFSIRIKHITVLNGRLYALTTDNKLYKAGHSTTGTLSSRALAIKGKGKTVVIVGVDLTGFNYTLIKEIKDIIYKKRNIPQSAILINASHTHFAPVTQAWLTWAEYYHAPDTAYLNFAKMAVIRSIEKALDNMTPSSIYFGRGSSEIGLNRRSTPGIEKPQDKTLDVLKIEDANKRIRSILFLTGCHPVFRNEGAEAYTLDANYPGVAKKLIEESTNTQNAIFIQGCGGDINPRDEDHNRSGQKLTEEVLGILNKDMKRLDGDISFAFDRMEIPVKPMSMDEVKEFKLSNSNKPGNLDAEKNVRWADLMLERYKTGKVANTLPLYIQTINIGNWKFVGLSREVVNEYGPAIRAIWPEKIVTVAGYSNDVPSYLPVNWHIQEKQYEGNSSFFWYGQSGIPPFNVLEIVTDRIRTLNK